MAIFKALTFDGVNSLDYGIYITGEAVYNAPERAVEMVNIPGKNGALALDQGRFENIEVTYHAGCFADNQAEFADKVMKFRNALASRYTYKRLLDGYHPDEYRLGLYKSGLDVDAVRYGTAGEFNIVFDCKPQRFLIDGDRAISPTEWSDVQTESGELVTIESDGSLAVKSLEVSLEPIQDLNGYSHPWVGGAGKNKANIDGATNLAGMALSNGVLANTLTDSRNRPALYVATYRGSTLVERLISVAYSPTVGRYSGRYTINNTDFDRIRIWHSGSTQDLSSFIPCSVSATGDYTLSINFLGVAPDVVGGFSFKEVQFEAGSTATSYEPYTNICPISGHTECVTEVCGVNVWDEEWELGGIGSSTGVPYSSSTSIRSKNFCKCVADQTYYFKGTFACYWYDENQGFIKTDYVGNNTKVAPTNARYFKIALYEAYGTTYNHDISINYPSTDHEYHAYNGTTYTTSLGRTVYGGTLDVVSGVLVVDRAIVDLGTLAWVYDSSPTYPYFRTDGITSAIKKVSSHADYPNCICSNYAGATENQGYVGSATGCVSETTWGQIRIRDNNYTDATAFKTAMDGVQLCYELATPQTYQLTPTEVSLLLGNNNVWSDGEITVEYGVHPYYNPTPFDAKPLIKVTGTGTLGIGEYILTITGTASQTLYIDCETMEIYTIEGTVPTGASSLVSINKNDFPVLEPGTNYISVGSGITAVTITPRWWRI